MAFYEEVDQPNKAFRAERSTGVAGNSACFLMHDKGRYWHYGVESALQIEAIYWTGPARNLTASATDGRARL